MIKLENMTIKETTEMVGGTEQLLQEMLEKFRGWLQQQNHLPQEIPDNRLRSLLLNSKFNLETAKKRLDLLYTLHTLCSDFFGNYDPLSEEITQVHKCMQWVHLPKLTPTKCRVIITRLINTDSSLLHPVDVFKYYLMLLDLRIDEDLVNSEIFIWDAADVTINHLVKYTPTVLKKYDLCLEAYGLRFKKNIHYNAPTYIDHILSLIKIFMKAKIYNRIQVFQRGIEELNEIVPKSILPVDYGGEELSMESLTDMWRAKLMERRNWLLEQEKLKTNESLRSDHVIDENKLFGVSGTFRKLDID
uniref:CRAL-TRIO domain containing protein n=1 Tax=Diacamma sp. Okinawa-2006a TaxID=655490 RepID=D4QDB4_9HYME|nr:CRAL-TRIO domain containing protein [Diacamma sp. Okinawa-2006a]